MPYSVAALLPPQPVQTQPPAQRRTDSAGDAGSQHQATDHAPAHLADVIPVKRIKSWPLAPLTEQQRPNPVVEPVQRHIGEGITDPGAGGCQQVVSSHHAGHADAHQCLQAEDRKAAAEDAGCQSPGALSRGAFLLPEPLQTSLQASLCLSQHPAHGGVGGSRMVLKDVIVGSGGGPVAALRCRRATW